MIGLMKYVIIVGVSAALGVYLFSLSNDKPSIFEQQITKLKNSLRSFLGLEQ